VITCTKNKIAQICFTSADHHGLHTTEPAKLFITYTLIILKTFYPARRSAGHLPAASTPVLVLQRITADEAEEDFTMNTCKPYTQAYYLKNVCSLIQLARPRA